MEVEKVLQYKLIRDLSLTIKIRFLTTIAKQFLMCIECQVSFEERELNGAGNPTFFGTPLSASNYSASSNRSLQRSRDCSSVIQDIIMVTLKLQMESLRPEVWNIQCHSRPLQAKQSCVQTRKTQHLQKTGGERRAAQARRLWIINNFQQHCSFIIVDI